MALAKTAKGRRFVVRGLLLGVAPIVALGVLAYAYSSGGRYISTENAYVKAEIINIGTSIDGRVVEVLVKDNQAVEAGQLLFRIDPRPFEMARDAAAAELVNVRQRIESLRAHYDQGREELEAARERIRYVTLEYDRQKQLRAKGFGTEAKFEEAEHELTMARRQLRVLEETNRMVLADLGGDVDLPVERHSLYLRAEAALERAELDLSYTEEVAPAGGMLSNVTLQAGEYVEVGDPLFALVTIGQPWVEANLKEVQLTNVAVGQSATVVVDSYPELSWEAEVESISPATGAEFALLPPQNATGNWVKVVQRIPVRLTLAEHQHLDQLRAGMTATVTIDTGFERDTFGLIRGVLAGRFERW